jgi:hypothetical protein
VVTHAFSFIPEGAWATRSLFVCGLGEMAGRWAVGDEKKSQKDRGARDWDVSSFRSG